MRYIKFMLLICTALISANQRVCAQNQKNYYAQRTINLYIGFGPGGENDVWGRLIARHIGDKIPGKPTILAQNMPGAGTLVLAKYLANIAPRDGTAIGLISRGIPLEPLFSATDLQFDAQNMSWIGSPDQDTTVCASRRDAEVTSLYDLRNKTLTVGGSGSGADTAIYPLFLRQLLNLKFNLVNGYAGSNEVFLALERHEVDGICLVYSSLIRQNIYRDGQMKVLFQVSLRRDDHLPANIPILSDIDMSIEQKEDLQVFLSRSSLGRPLVAPPNIGGERLQILRNAFDEMARDAAFLKEASELGLDADPISGKDLHKLILDVYKMPRQSIERVKKSFSSVSK